MYSSKQFLTAVLFTDIEGFSRISQENQELGLQLAQKHHEIIQLVTKAHQGECINFYGDGSMTIFDSVTNAVRCAIEMQLKFIAQKNLPVRIGLHLGEVSRDENSVYGDAVNIASRIQSIAPPGGILVSENIEKAVGNVNDFRCISIGKENLKNILNPIPLYYIEHAGINRPKLKSIHSTNKTPYINRFNIPVLSSLFGVLIVALFLLSYFFRGDSKGSKIPAKVISERLAIEPFEDLSEHGSDTILGKIAADKLITGLKKIPGTNIISFNFLTTYSPVDQASIWPMTKVPKLTSAENLIKGNFRKSTDSIYFNASLINLETGQIIKVFDEATSFVKTPMYGLEELIDNIKGYWLSKDMDPSEIPNYQAGIYYIMALDSWAENDSISLDYLNKSIQADSNFIDAYFLKLDLLYNIYELDAFTSWYHFIKGKFPIEKLTDLQSFYMKYLDADVSGNNLNAFRYYKHNYERDPKEITANTNMALLAIEYVNEPAFAIDVLKEFDPKDVDYFACLYCQVRLDLAIRAHMDMGNLEKIPDLISLYPKPVKNLLSNQLISRFYLMNGDISALQTHLNQNEILFDTSDLAKLYYYASVDAAVLGESILSLELATKGLSFCTNCSDLLLMQLNELVKNFNTAFDLASEKYAQKNYVYYKIRMAIYAAKSNEQETAVGLLGEVLAERDVYNPYGAFPYALAHLYTALGENDLAVQEIKKSILQGRKFYANDFHWDLQFIPIQTLDAFDTAIHPNQ